MRGTPPSKLPDPGSVGPSRVYSFLAHVAAVCGLGFTSARQRSEPRRAAENGSNRDSSEAARSGGSRRHFHG
jgi:hypothetical protein